MLLGIFLLSTGAGLLGSLVGLGGGVFVVPALTLLFHVDFRHATAASLVGIIATSSGAAPTYLRDGVTNLRIGAFLELATTLGAVAGAHVVLGADPRHLFLLFGLVLAASLPATLRRRDDRPRAAASAPGLAHRLRLEGAYVDGATGARIAYGASRPALGLGVMFGAGVASALLGIGSGPFKVLALDGIMGLPIKVSTTTSSFMIGVTAVASAATYFLRGEIDPLLAAPVALGSLLGARIGSRLLHGTTNRTIRFLTAAALAVVATEMIRKGLRSP
ncbi:MAG: sulfite exporter TauE/SafE family protein [Planctomycetes bacterium]|nr:sulfite exporter TauE/SafE family protein [Planctomycetota bacterium]